jgi:hypothetical protein
MALGSLPVALPTVHPAHRSMVTSGAEIVLAAFGDVSGAVEGTFSATVTADPTSNAAHALAGSFHVCHVPSEMLP